MFAIEVSAVLTASHALRLPPRLGGGVEPLHAHDFHVTVRLESAQLDDLGTVTDFHIVERALHDLLAPWQNKSLNGIPPFDRAINPSAERIAEHIAHELAAKLALPIAEVRITEAPNCLAIWRADPRRA